MSFKILLCTAFLSLFSQVRSQVKIGDNPNSINVNSLLELESSNKGLLPPRVSLVSIYSVTPLTATTPAGMLVYSLGGSVADGYYTWSGSKWLAISTDNNARTNYVVVKTAADFPAPVGGTITLVAGTMYEICGTVSLTSKINLNGCYIRGADPATDKLQHTGGTELFTGSGTGALRFLTLISNGSVFNINAANNVQKNLLIQNCYVVSSTNVGTLQGIGGTVFFSQVAYFGNLGGITFNTCGNVLLNTTLWDNTNAGTYEKFVGSFNIIQILGGDRLINSPHIALDVATCTVTAGSVRVVMFVGGGTFVNGTFSNKWEIESTGLDTQKDDVSTGNLFLLSPATTSFVSANTAIKAVGTTSAVSLFRMSSTSGELTYTGSKKKRFQVICSITMTPGASQQIYSFFIARNGTVLQESRQAIKLGNTSDQQSVTVSCTVEMATSQYLELYVRADGGTSPITLTTYNMAAK